MRIIQFILTGLIVAAGLIGALLLMAVGLVSFVLNRLFGRAATMPRFQRPAPSNPARPAYSNRSDDVIDVVTTEVKH